MGDRGAGGDDEVEFGDRRSRLGEVAERRADIGEQARGEFHHLLAAELLLKREEATPRRLEHRSQQLQGDRAMRLRSLVRISLPGDADLEAGSAEALPPAPPVGGIGPEIGIFAGIEATSVPNARMALPKGRCRSKGGMVSPGRMIRAPPSSVESSRARLPGLSSRTSPPRSQMSGT